VKRAKGEGVNGQGRKKGGKGVPQPMQGKILKETQSIDAYQENHLQDLNLS